MVPIGKNIVNMTKRTCSFEIVCLHTISPLFYLNKYIQIQIYEKM